MKAQIIEAGGDPPEVIFKTEDGRTMRVPASVSEAQAAAAKLYETVEINITVNITIGAQSER